MSIVSHSGKVLLPEVVSPETMYGLIREYGILPFFENPVAGFSVEEHTAPDIGLQTKIWGPGTGKSTASKAEILPMGSSCGAEKPLLQPWKCIGSS